MPPIYEEEEDYLLTFYDWKWKKKDIPLIFIYPFWNKENPLVRQKS